MGYIFLLFCKNTKNLIDIRKIDKNSRWRELISFIVSCLLLYVFGRPLLLDGKILMET